MKKKGKVFYFISNSSNSVHIKSVVNTNYLQTKYDYMADLLFILFGFSYFAYVECPTVLFVCSKPTQSNRRSAVQ